MRLFTNYPDLQLFFDCNGNVYLQYDNKLYNFNIDVKNNLSLEECINSTLFKKIKLEELKLNYPRNSLKNYVKKNIINNVNQINSSDHKTNYFYEDYELKDCESENDEVYSEEYVKFLSLNNDHDFIVFDSDDKGNSLYDTFIYNDDPEHGILCFRTNLIDSIPIYRLKIFTNGIISFREIGGIEKYYKLNVNNNLTLQIMS